jgi:hypothetical protein
MTGGMVIVSYTSSNTIAGSILMIQGINQSMTMTWFDQRITCGQIRKKAKHGEAPKTGKALLTVQRTDYAATATPVDPLTWDASMDAQLKNTRPFNTATTPLIVRQLLKNWASTIPQQWQVGSRSGLEPYAKGSTFK